MSENENKLTHAQAGAVVGGTIGGVGSFAAFMMPGLPPLTDAILTASMAVGGGVGAITGSGALVFITTIAAPVLVPAAIGALFAVVIEKLCED